jgi:hypothetical protein
VDKTLKIIKELESKKIIQDFSIGGGIAALYYIEPILTYDLDIFFIPVEDRIDVLSPIYDYLKNKDCKTQGEHILIAGVPVQFIPVYNELIKEAVLNTDEVRYGKMKTKVLSLEYLVAIMLQTNRAKDRERLVKIFEEAKVDIRLLKRILKKFSLLEKYKKFKDKHFESR